MGVAELNKHGTRPVTSPEGFTDTVVAGKTSRFKGLGRGVAELN